MENNIFQIDSPFVQIDTLVYLGSKMYEYMHKEPTYHSKNPRIDITNNCDKERDWSLFYEDVFVKLLDTVLDDLKIKLTTTYKLESDPIWRNIEAVVKNGSDYLEKEHKFCSEAYKIKYDVYTYIYSRAKATIDYLFNYSGGMIEITSDERNHQKQFGGIHE